MSIFKKMQEKRHAARQRKAEQMQGFTMQAELSATIVGVALLESGGTDAKFLVEYASGEKRTEIAAQDSARYAELMMYVG